MSSNSNSRPIAFCDSGVGGLTVYEKLKKLLPNENYLYFGDTKNVPYGEKTPEQLIEYSRNIFNFFEKKNIKAVVMACNTTSAVTYAKLKNEYSFKIYPIIQSVGSILASLPVKRLGVFATLATVNSKAYSTEINKLNPEMNVIELSCPRWVKIVEDGEEYKPENIALIEEKLEQMLTLKPEKIVLGCTHYPYLMPILTKFADKNFFIDPSEYFAQFIKNDLKELNTSGQGSEKFFVSSNPAKFQSASKLFYEVKELPELV